MSSARVQVDGVTFAYRRRVALQGVSMSSGPGVTAVVGANGAGKTTLLRVIAGIARPSSGSVRVDPADGQAPRIGYLPQNPVPTPLLRTSAYVEYFAYLAGVRSDRIREQAAQALQDVGMLDRAGTRTSALSGGMFRRVALAAALVARPDVLLLDEPTTGLDPVQRARFRELISSVAVGRVVCVATHVLEDVAPIAERVVVLDGSHTVFEGSVAELVAGAATGGAVAPGGTSPTSTAADVESAFLALIGRGDSSGAS